LLQLKGDFVPETPWIGPPFRNSCEPPPLFNTGYIYIVRAGMSCFLLLRAWPNCGHPFLLSNPCSKGPEEFEL